MLAPHFSSNYLFRNDCFEAGADVREKFLKEPALSHKPEGAVNPERILSKPYQGEQITFVSWQKRTFVQKSQSHKRLDFT